MTNKQQTVNALDTWNIKLANLSIRYYFFTSDEENEGGVTEAAAQPT